jgi:hypothetical protein
LAVEAFGRCEQFLADIIKGTEGIPHQHCRTFAILPHTQASRNGFNTGNSSRAETENTSRRVQHGEAKTPC